VFVIRNTYAQFSVSFHDLVAHLIAHLARLEEPAFDFGLDLKRRDGACAPRKKMRRHYRLDVQPDLFGQWCLIRGWGRTDNTGQARMASYPTAAQAHEALATQRRVKERRGYSVPCSQRRWAGMTF
jgi:predicted DNA-binding WGR domain protein